ncbi:MAG TPA: TIM-barrel domain-containing protein [Cytophagales bacterium]|nr:TIM-barrel domain-containing protein [Cytophagales bacterium]
MKKYSLVIIVYCLIILNAFSQTENSKAMVPGKCSSYQVDGSKVIFNCENNSKVLLQLCSKQIVKVWYEPTGNFHRNNESFAVVNEALEDVGTIRVEEQTQTYEIFTDFLRIRINKEPFQLQIFDKYQKMLLSDFKDQGLIKEGERLVSYKSLRSDEQFFGLGEKAGPLNRRGHSYKMWNSDKPCYGVNEDPLYKSIPFFLSSYQYGIFFDNTYKSEFKFGTESNDFYSFEAPGGEMLYYFIYGTDYKQIIEGYTKLTGNPIMPPKWAFGFSQSRGLFTREDLAREVANEFRKRQIPCDIIYQDIGWVKGLQDFDWGKGYKNPKQMVSDLNEQGFKMILSQDPVISQANKRQWQEADSLNYFTTDSRTGKSYDMPWPWGGNCGVVDFTKPEVADWWGSYQQKPLNDGVRGFWTDMGEPAWSNEDATDRLFMKHHLGMHDEIHNVYGLTWDKVVTEQFEKHNPNQRVFQMTRAAYAGLQRYTFGWSGDAGNGNNVLDGWKQLANQIPLSLSAGMGVIPFWACDISGYCGDIKDYNAMAELYVRWLQFGVFNPLSRAHHEGNNAVEPWLFGEEAEKISREAIELKYKLFPYIYKYARDAHDKGLPLMRALLLEFPSDEETYKAESQFMFGRELLVAPVVVKGAESKRVYFPEGEWIDFNDKKTVYKGGQWIDYNAPLNVIPVFARKGSIIPMMPVMQYIHEVLVYPVTLEIFPGSTNQEVSFELYEDDGESNDYKKDIFSKTMFTCTTQKEGYEVKINEREEQGYKIPGERNFVIKMHINEKPESILVNSKKVKLTSLATLEKTINTDFEKISGTWNKDTGECIIKIPDNGKASIIQINK